MTRRGTDLLRADAPPVTRAPDFTLPDPSGQAVSLSDRLRTGPVVLSFYRGDWCPSCNLELEFYTRLGCVVSAMLWRGLHRRGIALRAHDIWADPDAAARVRAAARGNETVPTVAIGPTLLVNPRVADVVAALELRAPHLVGAPPEPGAWHRRWRSLTGRSETNR